MNIKLYIFSLLLLVIGHNVSAIEIERFEKLDTRDGLSQNNILSIYCDHQDFLWFGTMDGLNRYDGYEFKIIKSEPGKKNVLTHNRISKIWEDKQNVLWVKTYDGYYHYYIRETDEFITFPDYHEAIEEENSIVSCFNEDRSGSVWLGTTNSGLYHLNYDSARWQYQAEILLTAENEPIGNPTINFLTNDEYGNNWVGTNNGLFCIAQNHAISSYLTQTNFSCGLIIGNQLFLGTINSGILIFDIKSNKVIDTPTALAAVGNTSVTFINAINNESLIIGTPNKGLYLYQMANHHLKQFNQFGDETRLVFTDSYKNIWLKTDQYGIVKIDPQDGIEIHFDLIEKEDRSIIDDERPFMFEDHQRNLWIGIHGGGLAFFDRKENNFTFYRNDPILNTTLSSDFVLCMAEDKSGLLWVGTGQSNGGANKVVLANPSFRHIVPCKNLKHLADNVVRFIYEDQNKNIWVTTKSGSIYIYRPNFELITTIDDLYLIKKEVPGYNIYAIMEDKDGYIWLGSKGGGVLVSKKPISKGDAFYQKLSFNQYQNKMNDSTSLSNNNVYSILQDTNDQIWISTYGGGLNRVVSRTQKHLACVHLNKQNSSLSSNDVRYLFQDSNKNLWVGTAFGLNVITAEELNYQHPNFTVFLYDPDSSETIGYNDIIHIFEDSKKQLWFGTFGGGVSLLKLFNGENSSFSHLKVKDGLANDAVFSILEDEGGKIWMGTENGISSYLPARRVFENYDNKSGLTSDNYTENACCRLSSGKLMFGNINGALVVNPETIEKTYYAPNISITNFQLNNRNVDIHDPNSPIKQTIETLKHIDLKYNQSSFSFEYAALSYLAPKQNNYAFMLDNFEKEWNYVGSQRKATYTNLTPGEYTFRVKAANWDGTWNEIPTEISITINPPWWKNRWALITYCILSLVILELSRRLFIKYYRMQNDLQVERRVNDIKLQFFTNISHEIRTPLTLILGPISDIKSIPHLPIAARNGIETMERNGQRMLKLLNQLLDFRKIQKKKMDLKIESIDLGMFIDDIGKQFTTVARHKAIDFKIIKTKNTVMVYVDPNRFDSVIFNILSNAFKYTPHGKQITVELMAPTKDYVEIQIADEGSGIPKEKRPYLFQRFTPLSSTDDHLNGSGIGLSLAYEIMQLHKGDIFVESEENQGSKFRIRLRNGKSHFDNSQIAASPSNVHYEHEQPLYENDIEGIKPDIDIQIQDRPLALVVEDNPEVLQYIGDSLKLAFKVETAKNGHEGLSQLKYIHPDIIITDLMMPVMDGIEMCQLIKANFDYSHIPVVMLTAKSAVADQIIGIESGAEAYILKPFHTEYLRAVTLNLIKQRELVIQKYRDHKTPETFNHKITTKDDQFLKELFKIIELNFTNSDFNVEQLIKESVYSRTVLYNKVKGLLGISPVDLIRQVRLKHAARLIREGGLKIAEAAYASGFNDPKYFRKCFKNQYGINPTDYKSGN